MSSRSESFVAEVAERRNGKNPSSNLVSVEEAFEAALRHGGLHVSDGSAYVAEPATIERVEEVSRSPFPVPAEVTAHFRAEYSDGSERYVSVDHKVIQASDDFRSWPEVSLGRAYVDGRQTQLDAELVKEIETLMSGADFWSNQEAAQKLVTELKSAKATVDVYTNLHRELEAERPSL